MKKLALTFLVGAALTWAPMAEAAPIVLTPADMVTNPAVTSNANCEPGCVYTAFGLPNNGSLELLYKMNVGGPEEGSETASYQATFSNSATDPSDADIMFISGAAISCPVCFLAVKSGNHAPYYYFYDLSSWNGTDTISLRNFWPDRGAISHVTIWGAPEQVPSIPEPASIALVGVGLAALARRRLRSRRG